MTRNRPRVRRLDRLRVLQRVAGDGHVIGQLRRIGIFGSLVVLHAIPLSGVVRVDLWSGDHLVLGAPAPLAMALPLVGVAAASMYLLTFVLNAVFGRLLCGFGCPVGQLFRLADGPTVAEPRWKAIARVSPLALLLASGTLWWFVSPRVLLDGSAMAVASTIGAGLALAVAASTLASRMRWRFCQSWCPIGVYWTAIQLDRSFGVQYDPEQGVCSDCGLCAPACPVGLDPKDLSKRIADRGGLALDGFPSRNYCLSCGDCVRVCKHMLRDGDRRPALEMRFGDDRKES